MSDSRRDHGFHRTRVRAVIEETNDAKTFVLDVDPADAHLFGYQAGQFLTVRASIENEDVMRCYSFSSAPSCGEPLAFTVKRVPTGIMSNWIHDRVRAGDSIDVTTPAGVFVTHDTDRPLIAFCGGSGITPVFSIVKHVLATTGRSVHLLYANRDRSSIIFAAAFADLSSTHADRFTLEHHLDDESGFLAPSDIATFATRAPDPDVYVCGPTPFMDIVERGLDDARIPSERVAIERFVAGAQPATSPTAVADTPTALTIVLKRKRTTIDYISGDTILDAARRAGLKPPFSCELGNCATCMAQVSVGSVAMRANTALTADEVADGWVLTCQGVPSGPSVTVEYPVG